MRVLLTGAAGLYGYHTLQEMAVESRVSRVFGLDDFSRGFPQYEDYVADSWGDKVQIITQRFQDCTVKEINSFDVDVVIHLAGFNSTRESANTPEEYFLNNEYGTFRFIQTLLRTRNKPLLIYASTTEVYGFPVYSPVDEKHPSNPLNIYSVTKLAAERHAMAAGIWFNYPVTALRLTNTFGENQNINGYTSVVCSFIDRALRNEPLIIYGTGEQARDLMYARDAAGAICAAAMRPKSVAGKVLNIATGRMITIRDLANKIIELTESTSEIINLPREKGEVEGNSIDLSLTQQTLNWQPRYKLEEGLIKTINWHRSLCCI